MEEKKTTHIEADMSGLTIGDEAIARMAEDEAIISQFSSLCLNKEQVISLLAQCLE